MFLKELNCLLSTNVNTLFLTKKLFINYFTMKYSQAELDYAVAQARLEYYQK